MYTYVSSHFLLVKGSNTFRNIICDHNLQNYWNKLQVTCKKVWLQILIKISQSYFIIEMAFAIHTFSFTVIKYIWVCLQSCL